MAWVSRKLLILFIFVCVVFPNDIYNLKKILLATLILLNINVIGASLLLKKNYIFLIGGLFFPLFLIIYSTFLTFDPVNSFLLSYSPFMIMLTLIINKYLIDFEKILFSAIWVVGILIFAVALLDILGVCKANINPIVQYFNDSDNAMMGASDAYPFYFKLFHKTSPLLVLPLFKYFYSNKKVLFLMICSILLFSGTRANVLFPSLFLIIFYLFFYNGKSTISRPFTILIAIMLVLAFSGVIYESLSDTFVNNRISVQSDSVRTGHFKGLIELVKDKPHIIITGQGMGYTFYSYGVNKEVSNIELQYFNLWRQMGIGLFLIFILFILIPFVCKYKGKQYKKFSYISYLLIAATNL